MARFGFVGGFYTNSAVNSDNQRCTNWYPEVDESGMGNSQMILLPTPGLKVFTPGLDFPIRGIHVDPFTGRTFFVGGSTFYELFKDGSYNKIASLNSGAATTAPVTFASNNSYQVCFISSGVIYLYNLKTNKFSVPTADLGPYMQIDFCDGYFIALKLASNIFQISGLEDGTSWNDADIAEVSEFSDQIVGMKVDHREIALWGAERALGYYNTGSNNFPFSPNPSSFIEQGSAAGYAQAQLDNSLFWIGASELGQGIAWRLNGYIPTRVSTHAIETEWRKYPTISDAIGWAYQEDGHTFWVLYFQSANKTWVYDVATQLWTERDRWQNGKSIAFPARCHAFAFGKHLVGDPESGTIYEMSLNYSDDCGNPVRRVRRAPHVSTEQQWMFHNQLQLYMESGLGPEPPLAGGNPTGLKQAILADPDGVLWGLSINDDGTQNIVQLPPDAGSPDIVILSDVQGGLWLLSITFNQDGQPNLLKSVGGPQSQAAPYLQFLTPTRQQFRLIANPDSTIATQGPFPVTGRAPEVVLNWSDDGGHTFKGNRKASAGKAGEFKQRVIWRMLGRSRDRVYEIVCTDPVPYRIVDAYLEATGYTPTERLNKQLAKGA